EAQIENIEEGQVEDHENEDMSGSSKNRDEGHQEWLKSYSKYASNKKNKKKFLEKMVSQVPKRGRFDDNGNLIEVAPVPLNSSISRTSAIEPNVAHQYQDEESWKSQVELTSVECELEGIDPPEPTFPFIQAEAPKKKRKRGGN